MTHKPIPKAVRQKVYEKYHGHCAYCGCELEYKDMQVDHVDSLWFNSWKKKGTIQDDSMDNLMPSCRMCNYYKGAGDIEMFRERLQNTLSNTCIDTFQARLAMKYGIIEYHPWNGKFYFEEEENDKRE
jgi:hypothetical protein